MANDTIISERHEPTESTEMLKAFFYRRGAVEAQLGAPVGYTPPPYIIVHKDGRSLVLQREK